MKLPYRCICYFIEIIFASVAVFFMLHNVTYAANATSTSAGGDWNDAATWIGGVVPGDGDTAVIANDATVTIPSGVTITIGTDPGTETSTTTPAIQGASTTGTGILVNNGTLKVKGPIRQPSAEWVGGPGSRFEHAGVNASYTWKMTGAGGKLMLNGTSGNRVTFTKSTGAQNWLAIGSINSLISPQMEAYFTDFSHVGTATTGFWYVNGGTTAGHTWILEDSTVDSCSAITNNEYGGLVTSPGRPIRPDQNFIIRRTKFTNPIYTTGYYAYLYLTGTRTTGTWLIEDSTWRGTFRITSQSQAGSGFVINRSAGMANTGGITTSPGSNITATITDFLNIETGTSTEVTSLTGATTTAPHQRIILARSADGASAAQEVDISRMFINSSTALGVAVDGLIIDRHNTRGGDTIVLDSSSAPGPTAAPITYSFKNTLLLPDSRNPITLQSAVIMVGPLSGDYSTVKWELINSTMPTMVEQAFGGEGGRVFSNTNLRGAEIKNNIMWATSSQSSVLVRGSRDGNSTWSDGTFDADYNWKHNISSSLYSGTSTYFTVTPGQHDGSGDPGFVDMSRNLITWARSIDGGATTTSYTDAFALIENDTSLIEDAYNWIRAGWAPTNTSLRAAGYDGSDIGAVSVVDLTAPTVSLTAPAASATVSGASVTLTATSTDAFGVVGVKFYHGSTLIGSEITATSSPDTYTTTWDTTALPGGSYSLLAVARDAAGNVATSSAVSVTVSRGGSSSSGATLSLGSVAVSSLTASSATVSWLTSLAADSTVEYGTSTLLGLIASSTQATTTHRIIISGLLPDTLYHYRVTSRSSQPDLLQLTALASFRTASAPAPTSTPPATTAPPVLPLPDQSGSTGSQTRLIKDGATFYLIVNGEKRGVTNPGLLYSHGFEFKDANDASEQDKSLPQGSHLLPGDGALVKSSVNPTVYLISQGKKHGFASAAVFTQLGFKFSSVLVVTAPELDSLPAGEIISSGTHRHLPGVQVSHQGTVYWLSATHRHPYPSLSVYNSWNKDHDFSHVVPANESDLELEVGGMVGERSY